MVISCNLNDHWTLEGGEWREGVKTFLHKHEKKAEDQEERERRNMLTIFQIVSISDYRDLLFFYGVKKHSLPKPSSQ